MKRSFIAIILSFQLGVTFSYPVPPPKDGYVPTAQVAAKVALPILVEIYGEEEVFSESPFSIELKGGIWIVRGVIKENPSVAHFGHPLEIWISKHNGQIVRREEEK